LSLFGLERKLSTRGSRPRDGGDSALVIGRAHHAASLVGGAGAGEEPTHRVAVRSADVVVFRVADRELGRDGARVPGGARRDPSLDGGK
jgi:hypothetical protein